MRDLASNLDAKRGVSPAAAGTSDTPIVSQILDTRDLIGAMYLILLGVNTDADATFAVLAEESDSSDMSGATPIPDEYLNGLESQAGFTAADDDNKLRKLGVRPNKRYARVTITPTGNNSGNIYVAAVWVVEPKRKPAANPPA